MIAITIPRLTPMSMEKMVSRMVPRSPSSTGGLNIILSLKMYDHWKCSFVISRWTNIASRTASIPTATQRPGCRTGTALIAAGRARSVSTCVVIGLGAGVHGRVGDAAGGDAPLVEDLLVRALADQLLDRGRDGLAEVRLVLGQHVPVRRGVVDLTGQRELTVGLLHRVRAHRRVGQHALVLAGYHRRRRVALRLVLVDGDGRLAGVGALLGPGGHVVHLDGAGLHRDLLAAGVVRVDGRARLRRPLRSGGGDGHPAPPLERVGVDGERGDADVVLA